eukprot:6233319-Prymnesium_polylepis.1
MPRGRERETTKSILDRKMVRDESRDAHHRSSPPHHHRRRVPHAAAGATGHGSHAPHTTSALGHTPAPAAGAENPTSKGGYDTVKIDVTQTADQHGPTTAIP